MGEDSSRSAVVLRMDAAFRAGDLQGLMEAAADEWDIPNGPMPMEIGSCLEYAIYHSPLSLVRDLLELGANPRPDDHAGFPPLVAALRQSTRSDLIPLIELLLSFGADPDQRGINDYTALQVAVIEGRADAVEQLLKHGADPHLHTRIDDMESTFDLAAATGNRSILALLEKYR